MKRETGACEKVSRGPNVDLRVNARRRAALDRIGSTHSLSETRQAARTGKCSHEEPVGPKRSPDQSQSSGQVVDAIEDSNGNDEIEAAIGERQAVLVALNPVRTRREKRASVGGPHINSNLPEPLREISVAGTEIERLSEVALHQLQPVDQLVGC